MSEEDIGTLAVLGFGLMIVAFHREIAARQISLWKRFLPWDSDVDLSAAYLLAGVIFCLVAIFILATR